MLYQFLCTENPPILTSTYSGIVITIWLQGIVSLVPSPRGQKQFVQDWSSSTWKFNALGRLYQGEIPQMGSGQVQSKFITSNKEEGNTQQYNTSQRHNSRNSNTTEGTFPQRQAQHRSYYHPLYTMVRRNH